MEKILNVEVFTPYKNYDWTTLLTASFVVEKTISCLKINKIIKDCLFFASRSAEFYANMRIIRFPLRNYFGFQEWSRVRYFNSASIAGAGFFLILLCCKIFDRAIYKGRNIEKIEKYEKYLRLLGNVAGFVASFTALFVAPCIASSSIFLTLSGIRILECSKNCFRANE